MSRPNWDDYFMKLAFVTAERSTCNRHHVGAVAVLNRWPLASGYNGAPAGMQDCLELGCLRNDLGIPSSERTEICLAGDTVIKLLNGTSKTMAELADDGRDFWTYSVDITTGELVPSLAVRPRRTKKVNSLCIIMLDNGAKIGCSPDHGFLKRSGLYSQAVQLVAGDSLFPMYYNFCRNSGYESVSNTIRPRVDAGLIRTWRSECAGRTSQTPTHVLVYEYFHGTIPDGDYTPHHVDEDPRCNIPDNLELLLRGEHTGLHNQSRPRSFYEMIGKLGADAQRQLLEADLAFMERKRLIGHQNMQRNWEDADFVARSRVKAVANGRNTALKTNSDPRAIQSRAKSCILASLSELVFRSGREVTAANYEELRHKFPIRSKLGEKGNKPCSLDTIQRWFPDLEQAIQESRHWNHKVLSVESVSVPWQYLYDVSVPAFENFPIEVGDNSCVFAHNCRVVHAEENALIQAVIHGVSLRGATLYCTHSPCRRCAKMLCNVGIKCYVTCFDYDDSAFRDLFNLAGIEFMQIPVPVLNVEVLK